MTFFPKNRLAVRRLANRDRVDRANRYGQAIENVTVRHKEKKPSDAGTVRGGDGVGLATAKRSRVSSLVR